MLKTTKSEAWEYLRRSKERGDLPAIEWLREIKGPPIRRPQVHGNISHRFTSPLLATSIDPPQISAPSAFIRPCSFALPVPHLADRCKPIVIETDGEARGLTRLYAPPAWTAERTAQFAVGNDVLIGPLDFPVGRRATSPSDRISGTVRCPYRTAIDQFPLGGLKWSNSSQSIRGR